MKKLLLTMLLMVGMFGVSNAQVDATMTKIDSGHTFITVEVDTTSGSDTPDSIFLLMSKTNPPTTHIDSVTSSVTVQDTLTGDGLDNGIKYYFRVVAYGSNVDTTGIDSVTTTDLTQTLSFKDTTVSSCSLHVVYANEDTGLAQIVVLWDSVTPPVTHRDSITTDMTSPVGFQIDSLSHNKTYYFRTIAADSGFSDTSAIASVLTESIALTVFVYDTTWRAISMRIEEANADSALKKLVLEVLRRGAGDTVYTRIDSSVSIDNNDDSLSSSQGTFDLSTPLLSVTDYVLFRVIATDTTGTDSTAVDSIKLDEFDWHSYNDNPGRVSPHIEHIKWTWTESGDTLRKEFDMDGYWGAKVWIKILGEENNHTFDSVRIITYSVTPHGDENAVDTIIAADMDTGTYAAEYIWMPIAPEDTVWKNRNGYEDWGTHLLFRYFITDSSASVGDTMDLDRMYIDQWIKFYEIK